MDTWRYIRMLMESLRERAPLAKEEEPSWTKILRKEEAEGSPFSGINMQTGRMAELDDFDIDWQPTPEPYPRDIYEELSRQILQEGNAEKYGLTLEEYKEWGVRGDTPEALADIKRERKETRKLTKSKKGGHSRYGSSGGYLPSDLSGSLKDDSIKSRILGHRRKPWS